MALAGWRRKILPEFNDLQCRIGNNCFLRCLLGRRFAVLYQGPSHSYKASRLQENHPYRFRIQATSDAGEGPHSEPATFSTTRALPPAPKGEQTDSFVGDLYLESWIVIQPILFT